MRKLLQNQKGFVLPFVLVCIALMTGAVSIFLMQQSAELKANVMNRDYQLCIFTAKNAMAVAQASLGEDSNYTGTAGLTKDENGGNYGIIKVDIFEIIDIFGIAKVFEISEMPENQRFFEIESHYKSFTKKFVLELEIMPDCNEINKPEITQVKWIMVKP